MTAPKARWGPPSLLLISQLALLCVLALPRETRTQENAANQIVDPALFQDLGFRMVGPTRGGRSTTVAGHPDHPHTFYAGFTGGGVWKTDDTGISWVPVSDGFLETGSIGAIRVAPSNSQIIYVGTGSDGIRSNVIDGRGVYRSTDGGATWSHLGLREVGQIGAVEVHPTNPDVVYVAAMGKAFKPTHDRGVFKTTDGGRSWNQVLFASDSVGAVDLELNPADPDEIYVAMYRGERKPWTIISGMEAAAEEDGIWKSSDAGETWRFISRGLPSGLIGKIDLAVSVDDPGRVYALVETTEEEEGLYRSDDRGESWELVSTQPGLMDRPFYYTNVDADPSDADVVYVNNQSFFKSTDGGSTFARMSTPHGDNHDMWINPDDGNIFIQANDGGVNVTLNGGRSWSTQYNQPTAELYQVDLDDRFPYWIYAGQQDNTTVMVPSNPPEDGSVYGHQGNWKEIGGCETGPAVPKPGDPSTVYSNCKGRFGRYSQLTGQEQQYYVWGGNLYGHNPRDLPYRFQRVVPIEVSPHDPDVVYHGSQFVHKTVDGGINWEAISPDLTAFRPERQVVSGWPITRDITGEEHYSVLYVIEESPVQEGVIWTGANDGPVHVSRDGGANWTDVTPPMPPEGRIQTIDPSPHDQAKAYVAAYRYLLGDFEPYIFKTEDYGRTWARLTDGANGIPADYPTRVVREDPDAAGLLYAGTEFGIFISFDDGGHWQSFQLNLPVTPITDIRMYRQDMVLSTMGRSFWVMDDVTPLHELRDGVRVAAHHLFTPANTYRLRSGFGGLGFGGPDPSAPQYSSNGAFIDYVVGPEGGDVSLQILGVGGEVVRTFRGGGAGMQSRATQGMRAPQRQSFGTPRLDGSPGMHRFLWDLRVEVPGGRSGPMALPGDYQARLTIGDWNQTQSFKVMTDPRVEADGVTMDDLRAQFDFNVRVAELSGAATELAAQVEDAIGSGRFTGRALEQLREVQAAMVDAGGSYPQPMFLNQIRYLQAMTSRADQRPGNFAYSRLEELSTELAELTTRVHGITGGEDR
jgi:photosystem II stability/assembly factor-like uncharacterized protein